MGVLGTYVILVDNILCLFAACCAQWYDPDADCWTDSGALFDLPYKRLRYCGATHQSDQRIYIFGGQSLPGPTEDTYSINATVNWYQVQYDKAVPAIILFT